MDFNRLFKTTFDQFVKGIVKLILFNLVGCLLCLTIVLIPTVARGLTAGMLRYAREGIEPEFDELWRFDDYLQIALFMIVAAVAIGLGLLLLVVPGVLLMVWWMYALYFMVDRKLSFSQAMGASKQLVGASGFGNHFVVLLIMTVLNSLGSGLAGFGTLITAPFAFLLVTNAYVMATGEPAMVARPGEPQ